VKIHVPKKEEKGGAGEKGGTGEGPIRIEAPTEKLKEAEAAILQLVNKGYTVHTHANMQNSEIIVPYEKMSVIIGPKGATLHAIQDKTKTKVTVPGPGQGNRVTIVGSKEGIKQAKEAIKSLITDGYSSITHDGFVKEKIDFPHEKRRYLIGPRGQTIKSIQGNTKAHINTPEGEEFVYVIGTQQAVDLAKKAIEKILNPVEAYTQSARREREESLPAGYDPKDPNAEEPEVYGEDEQEYIYRREDEEEQPPQEDHTAEHEQ